MSIFGKYLPISIFGASHEKYIGLTIHNFPCGIKLNIDNIKEKLRLRRGLNFLTSKRLEDDEFEIISGVFNDYTTGAPLTVLIKNKDVRSSDYEKFYGIARPSHADYTYYMKYNGYNDYRGGGTSSGRLTVALVVIGALCEELTKVKGINIASRIKQINTIVDEDVEVSDELLTSLSKLEFPVITSDIKEKMLDLIEKTENDSLGGIVETYVSNLPVGLGEPFFDSFESIMSHLIFSIPGVKGIEFGSGFKFASMYGSMCNDEMKYEDGKLVFLKNHNGGINGGITNGNLVNFKTVFKPTSSISIPQQTINFINETNEIINIRGRHDKIILVKGLHVVNAVTTYAIAEMLMGFKNG